MIEEVRKQVCKLLDKDNSGHVMEHVDRVLNLSLKFSETMIDYLNNYLLH